MNYKQPRQREKDKRWDFTNQNDGRIQPIGYCHAYRPIPDNSPFLLPEQVKQHNEEEQQFAHKYHADGHATEDEARECYREYLLDHQLRLNENRPDEQRKCVVCGEWTTLSASVDMQRWVLCEQHNNREEVEKLFGPVGNIISSW